MRRWMVVAIMFILMLPMSSAAGGGWWSSIHLEDAHIAVRAEVKVDSLVMFSSAEEAEAARAGTAVYYAYLMPYPDKDLWDRVYTEYKPDWWTPQEDSILIGRLSFHGPDSNLITGSITFEVPEVEPGKYALMFCTAGCEDSIGDIIPTQVKVVASPAHAAAANRVDRLVLRLNELRNENRQKVRGLERRISARDRTGEVIDERMDEIDARLLSMTALREQPDAKPSSLPYLLAGGLVGAALGAGAIYSLMRTRKREGLTDKALTEFLKQESGLNDLESSAKT